MRKPFNNSYPITQPFGGAHKGIDYGTPLNTPMIATADGIVTQPPFQEGGFGTYAVLKFGDITCYYGHLNSLTRTGAVKVGEVIGLSGSTGNSTGPHLHFETYQGNKLINPEELYKQGGQVFNRDNVKVWFPLFVGRDANDNDLAFADKYISSNDLMGYLDQGIIHHPNFVSSHQLRARITELESQTSQPVEATVLKPGIYKVN